MTELMMMANGKMAGIAGMANAVRWRELEAAARARDVRSRGLSA